MSELVENFQVSWLRYSLPGVSVHCGNSGLLTKSGKTCSNSQLNVK